MNKNDLEQIGELIDDRLGKAFDRRLKPIEDELKQHGKMLRSLKKNQDTMLRMLDKEQMNQSKRLKKVEDHLGITSSIL